MKFSVRAYAGFVLITLIFLFLIKALNISYPLTISTSSRSSELSVVGEGKIEAIPDTAYIEIGVMVDNGSTVDVVQKQLDTKNSAIVDAMKNVLKIPSENIKTSNYSISPNYDYTSGKGTITGYNGNVTLTVKTADLEVAPKVVEEATKVGANQIQGIRWVIDSPEKYRENARSLAIDNAKKEAEKLSKTLGITLGKVVNFVESNSGEVPPIYRTMLDSSAKGVGGGAQFEPGSQTITSTVTLYFEKL